MSTIAEKDLLDLARQLPAARVQEVVDFAEFLLTRPAPRRGNGARGRRGAVRDYIGGVKDGRLAQGIDDELYGRAVR